MPPRLVSRFAAHGSGCAVRNVAHNVDGDFLLTCGADKTLNLYTTPKSSSPSSSGSPGSTSCRLLKSYKGHGNEVLDACGSCDNSLIASCSKDRTIVLWDVATAVPVNKFRGHVGDVNCVKFTEDSSLVLSGSQDGSVRCWDALSRRSNVSSLQSLEESRDAVTSLDVSDHEILAASADGKVRRYDLRNGKLAVDTVAGVAGHSVSSAVFTRDTQCILVAVVQEKLRLLDKSTGELLQEFHGHVNEKYRIHALLDFSDKCVLSGSEDGNIFVWNLIDADVVAKLDHGQVVVHSLSQHPKKPQIVSVARDHVYVWEEIESEDEAENN